MSKEISCVIIVCEDGTVSSDITQLHGVPGPIPGSRRTYPNRPKPVMIDGMKYDSIWQASDALGISRHMILAHCATQH